jgi:hypothetical protein
MEFYKSRRVGFHTKEEQEMSKPDCYGSKIRGHCTDDFYIFYYNTTPPMIMGPSL